MLLIPPPKYRKTRRVAKRLAAPALVLESAYYNPTPPTIYLQFDRAIDISALNAAAITVKDGTNAHAVLAGVSGAPSTAKGVLISMVAGAAYAVAEQKLFATALSGIAAVDDGGTWMGVSDLAVPF